MKEKTLALSLLLLAACGPRHGTLRITAYGEEFVEEGIPAEVFADGWSIHFTRFAASLADVSAGSHLAFAGPGTFDLVMPSAGAGQLVAEVGVPGGSYELAWRLVHLEVEGSAQKGSLSKTFHWAFPRATRFAGCAAAEPVDGNVATAQLTLHADHLFYDDLISEDPRVAFDLVAQADADDDGEVTEAELRALPLATQARYQVGSTGVDNLWDFIAWQVSTVGHIDGEGHCETVDRDQAKALSR